MEVSGEGGKLCFPPSPFFLPPPPTAKRWSWINLASGRGRGMQGVGALFPACNWQGSPRMALPGVGTFANRACVP